MEDKVSGVVFFIPFIIIFFILLLDSRFGMDRIEIENSQEKDKSWLFQKVTIGRNPHLEYSTSPSKSERWQILLLWFVICSIFYLIFR